MNLDIFVVDAFADAPFTGNPAAVVPLEAWLPDETLQAIAAQHNLSETAFFVPRSEDAAYDLRWFTPNKEVDLCGHATLATAAVIMEDLALGLAEVQFHTRSGVLPVVRDGNGYTLDFPSQPATAQTAPAELAEALGGPIEAILRARYWLVVYPTEADVRALAPDMAKLSGIDGAVIATAPGDHVDFVSRFFAPKAGIPEDPVTGSAHCTLAPYWAARLAKKVLTAHQISARGGMLGVSLIGDRVHITGRVHRYLDGRISV